MRKIEEKIVLRGHEYATPRTESVVVKNQGVLCGSGGGAATSVPFGIGVNARSL